MTVEFECELELPITVTGEYKPGTPAQITKLYPNGLPGDPEEVELTSVKLWKWVNTKDGRDIKYLDITDILDDNQKETLLDFIVDQGREDQEG